MSFRVAGLRCHAGTDRIRNEIDASRQGFSQSERDRVRIRKAQRPWEPGESTESQPSTLPALLAGPRP